MNHFTTTVVARARATPTATSRSCNITLGGLGFGNHYGRLSDHEAIEVIHEALDGGVNAFETSPDYGHGRAEELLGRALKEQRNDILIGTKLAVGHSAGNGISRDAILRSLEGSLRRLRRDYVDTLSFNAPGSVADVATIMEMMEAVRASGHVRSVGFSVSSTEALREALRYGTVNTVWVTYNILSRSRDPEFLSSCREAGVPVNACETFCRGLLLGRLHKNSVFEEGDVRVIDRRFRGDRFRANLQIVDRLRSFAAEEGLTLPQLTLGWVLQHPSISSAVCGARTPDQICEIVAASATRLTLEQILEIDLIVGEDKFQAPS